MSMLFPLYLLGAMGIGLPILLHLTRRKTKKQVEFSSLMFLKPSPPRIDRRSRLEHLLLLALRCLALLLIAAAFARPYFQTPPPALAAEPGNRVLVLVDRSASMQREGLWAEAIEEARAVLAGLRDEDRAAVALFDDRFEEVMGFEGWAGMAPGDRVGAVTGMLGVEKPGYRRTDLGGALAAAAQRIEEDDLAVTRPVGESRIVLVSDVQRGASLAAMNRYQWPETIALEVKAVEPTAKGNAGLAVVMDEAVGGGVNEEENGSGEPADTGAAETGHEADAGGVRLRISNAADSEVERFTVMAGEGDPIEAYVPAGRSRVVRIERPPVGAAFAARLSGDGVEFDNVVTVGRRDPRRVSVVHVGPGGGDVNDPSTMAYYLSRALGPVGDLEPVLTAADGATGSGLGDAALIFITGAVSEQAAEAIRRRVEAGATAVASVNSEEAARGVSTLLGAAVTVEPSSSRDEYALLAELDTSHPLLSAFADPRFGDFSKVHLWRRWSVKGEGIDGAAALARYDDGEPAWMEKVIGRGRVLLMTSGWEPRSSQLALSSKFVPLIVSLLEWSAGAAEMRVGRYVGDSIPLNRPTGSTEAITVTKAGGQTVTLPEDATEFTETDEPGMYRIRVGDGAERIVAVNLHPSESATEPLDVDRFERLGVALRSVETAADPQEESDRVRLQHRTELEAGQKLWRWIVVGVIGVLLVETLVANRAGRGAAPKDGDAS